MAALGWLLRALLIMFIVRVILRALFPVRVVRPGAPGGPAAPQPRAERAGGELVRDPNCGTYVPKAHALAVGRGDSTQYFCSAACRDAWAKAHA